MLYKFKSKAAGDVIMLGPNGDQVMRILGREPAPQGIIEVAAMPAAIAALSNAVAQDEATGQPAAEPSGKAAGKSASAGGADRVTLRQRVWPLVEMLRRCQAEGHEIVWGV